MFITIMYVSLIFAVVTAISRFFKEKVLKWPLIVVVVVLWFATESKSDIVNYLQGEFLGGKTVEEIIRPYYILLWVYVIAALIAAYLLVKLSIKTDFTKEKNIDILTALIIFFVTVIGFLGTLQCISKFYDSSYIYCTPLARALLILWASVFVRRYMAEKYKKHL